MRGAGQLRRAAGRARARALEHHAAERHARSVPWRTAADFRSTLPANGHFFDVYAKGTYENAPRFGAQQYRSMPGRYLFLLAGNFDTTSLPNGVYTLGDLRGRRARQPGVLPRAVLRAERAERRLPRLARRAADDRAAAERAARRLRAWRLAAEPELARVRAPVDALQPLDLVDVGAGLRELDVLALGAPARRRSAARRCRPRARAARRPYFCEQVVEIPGAVADVDLGVVEIARARTSSRRCGSRSPSPSSGWSCMSPTAPALDLRVGAKLGLLARSPRRAAPGSRS